MGYLEGIELANYRLDQKCGEGWEGTKGSCKRANPRRKGNKSNQPASLRQRKGRVAPSGVLAAALGTGLVASTLYGVKQGKEITNLKTDLDKREAELARAKGRIRIEEERFKKDLGERKTLLEDLTSLEEIASQKGETIKNYEEVIKNQQASVDFFKKGYFEQQKELERYRQEYREMYDEWQEKAAKLEDELWELNKKAAEKKFKMRKALSPETIDVKAREI